MQKRNKLPVGRANQGRRRSIAAPKKSKGALDGSIAATGRAIAAAGRSIATPDVPFARRENQLQEQMFHGQHSRTDCSAGHPVCTPNFAIAAPHRAFAAPYNAFVPRHRASASPPSTFAARTKHREPLPPFVSL